MTHALFEPIRLRDVEFRNRVWVSPMCQYSVERQNGVPTDWHLVHLGGFAKGGVGGIVVESTGVLPEGRISPQDLGIWNDEQVDAFRRITAFAHAQDAKIGVQLQHAGRKASTFREWGTGGRTGTVPVDEGGWRTVAPSAVAFDGYDAPAALDQEGIDRIVGAFAAGARRALDAGFDFVEVHGAHGYLVHQFLSPISNRRGDEYGGSIEHRARILLQIVDAIRAEVGETVPVIVRLSATDWTDGGLTLEETESVTRWLAEHHADLVDVSTGGNVPGARIPTGPGYQVPFATAVKQASGLPVGTVGQITDPVQAEQIVATGLADVVLLGRELLRDPHFALRAAREVGAPVPTPPQYGRAWR